MTQYYLPPDTGDSGMPPFDGVVSDLAEWIPADPDNRHWAEYQDWLAEGNEPLPYPPDGISVPPSDQVSPA
jgi:hypothetical protein